MVQIQSRLSNFGYRQIRNRAMAMGTQLRFKAKFVFLSVLIRFAEKHPQFISTIEKIVNGLSFSDSKVTLGPGTIPWDANAGVQRLRNQLNLMTAKGSGSGLEWKAEWGERPIREQIAAARELKEQGLRGRDAALAFAEREIEIDAMFYVDRELTAEVLGHAEGAHVRLGREISHGNERLALEIFDLLILAENSNSDIAVIYTRSLMRMLLSISEGAELAKKIFGKTKKKSQFVNQLVYAFSVNTSLRAISEVFLVQM